MHGDLKTVMVDAIYEIIRNYVQDIVLPSTPQNPLQQLMRSVYPTIQPPSIQSIFGVEMNEDEIQYLQDAKVKLDKSASIKSKIAESRLQILQQSLIDGTTHLFIAINNHIGMLHSIHASQAQDQDEIMYAIAQLNWLLHFLIEAREALIEEDAGIHFTSVAPKPEPASAPQTIHHPIHESIEKCEASIAALNAAIAAPDAPPTAAAQYNFDDDDDSSTISAITMDDTLIDRREAERDDFDLDEEEDELDASSEEGYSADYDSSKRSSRSGHGCFFNRRTIKRKDSDEAGYLGVSDSDLEASLSSNGASINQPEAGEDEEEINTSHIIAETFDPDSVAPSLTTASVNHPPNRPPPAADTTPSISDAFAQHQTAVQMIAIDKDIFNVENVLAVYKGILDNIPSQEISKDVAAFQQKWHYLEQKQDAYLAYQELIQSITPSAGILDQAATKFYDTIISKAPIDGTDKIAVIKEWLHIRGLCAQACVKHHNLDQISSHKEQFKISPQGDLTEYATTFKLPAGADDGAIQAKADAFAEKIIAAGKKLMADGSFATFPVYGTFTLPLLSNDAQREAFYACLNEKIQQAEDIPPAFKTAFSDERLASYKGSNRKIEFTIRDTSELRPAASATPRLQAHGSSGPVPGLVIASAPQAPTRRGPSR